MSRRRRFERADYRVRAIPLYPTADDIARRAHQLFVSHGRSLTHLDDHWRTAEQELLERAAARVIGRGF